MLTDKSNNSNRAKREPDEISTGLQATHYGITGHVVVQPADELQAFKRFTGDIVASLEPETSIERHLAHLYAACQWRVTRAAALEDTLFTVGIMEGVGTKMKSLDEKAQTAVSHALTFRNRPEAFEKISVYSANLVSQGAEVLAQLKQLQAERRKQATDHMADAARLYLYYRMQNRTFDPRENGVDLTVAEIENYIRQDAVRHEAAAAQKAGFNAERSAPHTGSAGA